MKLCGLDLTCERGGRRVFSRIIFSITAGKALILTGANGSGKSSLLRVIAGLVRPVEGTVALEGGNAELGVGEQAHYLGHVDPLKPALTVTENLTFWSRFLNGGPATDAPVERALAVVGLTELAGLPAGYLSAGQRRRLSLARILAAPRPIWLLDEPASALDAASQDRLRQIMRDHLSAGGIVVAATHGPLGLKAPAELRLGTQSAGETRGASVDSLP